MARAQVLEFLVPSAPPLTAFLRERAVAGLAGRVGEGHPGRAAYVRRLEAELAVFDSERLVTLALTVGCLARVAAERHGLVQGHHRVTGSLLAYALGVTDVDPVEAGLGFDDVFVPGLPFPEVHLHVSSSSFAEVAAVNADQCYPVASAEPGKDCAGHPIDKGMVVLYRSRRLELLHQTVELARRRRSGLTVRAVPCDDASALEFLVWCHDRTLVSPALARVLAALPGRTFEDLVVAYALSQPAARETVLPSYLAARGSGVPVFRHQVEDGTAVDGIGAATLRQRLPERHWLVASAATTARLAWLAVACPAEWAAAKRRVGPEAAR